MTSAPVWTSGPSIGKLPYPRRMDSTMFLYAVRGTFARPWRAV